MRPAIIKKLIRVGAVTALLATFAYLLYGGLGSNIVYFLTPGELLAKGADAIEAPVRLGGHVADSSVIWDAKTMDLRFRVTDGERAVSVHSTGAPPQMFRPGIGVVVEGRFGNDGIFRATNLLVKHSNEYRAPKDGHTPAEAYRSLIKPAAP